MRSALSLSGLMLVAALGPLGAAGQSDRGPGVDGDPTDDLPWDRGAAGLHQALQRLSTTGSLLHTTAHPDDEQAGLLTRLARGQGVRTSLLVLNRGEAGANAIGPELFDGLGLIRTEELLLAGRYYGLSQVYFTSAVDYGYSKTLDEAMRSWDREALLEDMVRIIRTERPLVVVSRWHGSERDGHGHHHAMGVLTPEAVQAAADPSRFPDQIRAEGLEAWKVARLYRSGIREGEPTDVVFQTTLRSPWLGTTYQAAASYGLSLQRSQTSGRIRRPQGPVSYRYQRLADPVSARPPTPAVGFFEGLDLSLSGLFSLTGEQGSPAAQEALDRAQAAVAEAQRVLRIDDLEVTAPALTRALSHLRDAQARMAGAPEARRIVDEKVLDAMDALRIAHGVSIDARASDGAGRPVHRVAGGQTFDVAVSVRTHDPTGAPDLVELSAPPGWSVTRLPGADGPRFRVTVAENSHVTGTYFGRSDIRSTRYEWADSSVLHQAWRPSPLAVRARFGSGSGGFTVTAPVRGEEPQLPRGVALRELQVVPRVSVSIDPTVRVVPSSQWGGPQHFLVTVTQSAGIATEGHLGIRAPSGWTVTPETRPFATSGPQTRVSAEFVITPPNSARETEQSQLEAIAYVDGEEYTMTERRIVYPDLEPRSLYAAAKTLVRRVPVVVEGSPTVAYVEGVGDEIPAALSALGTPPTVLTDEQLSEGDLTAYDIVVVGTRAYAVRDALVTANDRMLEFVRQGGHLVVLYQTPEFDAAALAPYAAELPRNAEEVSEEDAPIRFLAPAHPLLTTPNRLVQEDFEAWVEQRGSKFFTTWGDEFTPLIETQDVGQPPQSGIWLTAPLGNGHWTYNALALHRQTPYGVPGAYRILANLLSYGRD